MLTPNPTLFERLHRRLLRNGDNGCLEWVGYVDKATGYGKIANRPEAPLSIHVASWLVHRGPIPEGLLVRHKCDNRLCGDVEHLELGTQAENVADMVSRGRCNNSRLDVTTCPAGHEYDIIDEEGYRSCRRCRNRRARRDQADRRRRLGLAVGPKCPFCYFHPKRCECETT